VNETCCFPACIARIGKAKPEKDGVSLTKTLELVRIEVRGVVQGVGFRPFIYQLAKERGLNGWVRNTSRNVEIEGEGEEEAIELLLSELESKAPPMARIERIDVSQGPVVGYQDFEITRSQAEEGRYQLISADVATCEACLSDTLDPRDRRYRSPFTNCTNCRPRFMVIEDIPHDRPRTTMRHFQMCPLCQEEYHDPRNRRFHAQPNACPTCGPSLQLPDRQGRPVAEGDILAAASRLLRGGDLSWPSKAWAAFSWPVMPPTTRWFSS